MVAQNRGKRDRDIAQKLFILRLCWRVEKQLCIKCGIDEQVSNGLCPSCRLLPSVQEILAIEIPEPKYYLTVGNEIQAEKQRDCLSDSLERAEQEAEDELQVLRAEGDLTSLVRVVEVESGLVVYATGRAI